jgi:hypothetical protein
MSTPELRRLLPLRIPGGCVVFNALYEIPEAKQSTLLMVRQETWFIDLSWVPADEPSGCYVLQVIGEKASEDDDPWQHPAYRFETKSRAEAIDALERVLMGDFTR